MIERLVDSSRRRPRMAGCIAILMVLASAHATAQGPSAGSSKAGNEQASQTSAVVGAPNALQGFSQNRGQPIHIDAARLEVRDKDKIATFTGDAKTGDVKVVQGDTVMRSKVLVVFYEQQAPGAPPAKAGAKGAPAPAATPGPGGSQQIKRLEAKGNVIVTQNDQTVTGDNGVFDTKANTVTMHGNVTLTQGKNVMQGQTLIVDLTTGVSRLETGNGRVQGLLFPNSQNPNGAPGGAPGAPNASGGTANPPGKPMNLNGINEGSGR
jgi:lipopolysaccharide export system protein LptA